ncbi:MAG: radical SAM protein [Candidatus Cloacimonetes bacterium]|nr:radical SAM protein [Candidatus Cloacimonadota bacterium]
MAITILDCYTDEPAGLGVPPYIGTYPRYIAGYFMSEKKQSVNYLTIDDLRLHILYAGRRTKDDIKTKIKTYNLTNHNVDDVLSNTTDLIIILGVHTPGKYLSAVPGTIREITSLLKNIKCRKILTGPAIVGTQVEGGRFAEKSHLSEQFDEIKAFDFNYEEIADYSVQGAYIINQIDDLRLAEIETSKGCSRTVGCSFCTEPIKNKPCFRDQEDIIAEIKALKAVGIDHFRLGKQSCFYSYKGGDPAEIEKLLKPIAVLNPKTLHIDNVNPARVTEEITKLIVKYCTSGNIAAFGVESFDPVVCEKNNLNTRPEIVHKAVKILNEIGGERGENGLPKFLPGINILMGLIAESKQTFQINYDWLKKFLDEDLLIRRINIRKVVPFEGTMLHEKAGNKFLRKNKKHYFSFRRKIREEIDHEFLKKLTPVGTVLKDVRMEVHDGNTTFGRQIGTYPLIVGVKGRYELGKFYDVEVIGHMLRSIIAELATNK